MPPKKSVSITEILESFFDPSTTISVPKKDILISPFSDLAFNDSDCSFYYYYQGAWSILSDSNVKFGETALLVEKYLFQFFPSLSPNTNKIIEIKESFFRACPTHFSTDSPPHKIAFQDQTLDLDTFDFVAHDRKHFALLSFDFSSASLTDETPSFTNYLNDSFSSTEEISLIYDMIGYYLLPHDREPAAFYLYGPPRTGKSRFMHLMQSIFTPKFSSSFTLQSLTTQDYAVAELAGKFINILDEDESERISSDRFKALLDHSYQQARRLFQAPFTFRPYTKFLVSSNQLPNFRYVDGLERRLHFVHFRNVVPTLKQDKDLSTKIITEIPGIIGRALIHARAFLDRNSEFIFPQSSLDLKQEFTRMVVPAILYVHEFTTILPQDSDSSSWISNLDLYNSYRGWCEISGHKPLAAQNFHRQLLCVPSIISRVVHNERRKNLALKSYDFTTSSSISISTSTTP